jgi:hypothetical protein
MSEAAMEDADQPVSQRTESLVVRLAASSVGIVIGPSAWRSSQRRICPAKARVYKVAVARHSREHGVACARGARDRSRPGVGLACLRIAVASGIVTKLGQRSRTERRS